MSKLLHNETKEILRQLSERLRAKIKDAEVILYGSTARGEATPQSDIDVCVIVPELDRETRDLILDIAWEVSYQWGAVISPLIFSKKEWLNSPITESTIYKNIKRDGVRI
ncbi:nucleotidyltransferase domain-containing protein [Candidatus Sumerlaeota bacterium]|nr:nucleotidyltransferase domain-containing protein [Candidatus Sumerlaeota bacterium]